MTTKIARPRPCVKCGSPSYAYELEKIDQGYRAYWACSKEFCFGRFYTTELSTSFLPITKEELAKLQPNPAKGIATIEDN